MPKILIIDPDPQTRDALEPLLADRDAQIADALDGARGLELAATENFDLVIAELHAPEADGMQIVERCGESGIPVILVTAFCSAEDRVAATRAGASDFLSKPFIPDQLQLAVSKALDHSSLVRENRDLREALDDRLRLDNYVSTDPRMHKTLKTVRSVAPTRTTVLITGESGTGKTLLARGIHGASDRASGPFVEVNCGALPENLLESELFGHVRGAFTGAVKDRPGKFEAADGGTIFLDEIGTASQSLQVKLLRVLQERQLERVGDSRRISVDVRVILATNLDLKKAVEDGDFREDLYYRINVVELHVPPLRERTGDVVALAEHFLTRIAADIGKDVRGFSSDALERLCRAPWPGNVRQLENVIERAVVLAEGSTIGIHDLPPDLSGPTPGRIGPESLLAEDAHLMPLKQALEGPEKLIIERALAHHGGNRQETARSLGVNRSTLFNKMRKFDLL